MLLMMITIIMKERNNSGLQSRRSRDKVNMFIDFFHHFMRRTTPISSPAAQESRAISGRTARCAGPYTYSLAAPETRLTCLLTSSITSSTSLRRRRGRVTRRGWLMSSPFAYTLQTEHRHGTISSATAERQRSCSNQSGTR